MSVIKAAMAGLSALILSIGITTAIPAEAQTQNGLVNVAIGDITTGDILSNNRVGIGVAANVAANVCGVTAQVGVIAQQVAQGGNFRCDNQQTSRFVQITQ
jgi:hypothetical protein